MYAIEVNNLTKIYSSGTQALKGADFKVEQGDFCALLGANGAGKTTMIGIFTGLVTKTSGKVRIFNWDIDTDHPQAKQMIGVVPQEMNFNFFEKAEDIVIQQGGYFGINRAEAKTRCEALLKRLRLWEKRSQPSRNLSGGMKRRLMIARALINQPKLLILDEPTAGVDVELRYSMWEFLKEINAQGTTILLTTHYLEEVEQMCQHAAIIKNGEIMTFDTVRNLVGLLDVTTYVVSVDKINSLEGLSSYSPRVMEDNTFEIELKRGQTLDDFIKLLLKEKMSLRDLHPQGNRMEKLYLQVLKSK